MNIIFLDMDGVINSGIVQEQWVKEHGTSEEARNAFIDKFCMNSKFPYYYIVPELLERFNTLYSKIDDCKVVWSSSWRNTAGRNSKRFVEGLYYKCGLPKNSFLGYTPYIPYMLRNTEILEWIFEFRDQYKIDKCAIIDDLEEAEIIQTKEMEVQIKFFKTSSRFGLTQEIADEILNYFNERENKND